MKTRASMARAPYPHSIWQDVGRAVSLEKAIGVVRPNDVVWTWRFDFESHWSKHAVEAIRALQSFFYLQYAHVLPETFPNAPARVSPPTA